MLKEVNIFKAGLQTAESGMSREFTLSELDEIVSSYDPLAHEAPIRIGHEDNDKVPAWGWVKGLIRKGEDLYAKIDFSPLAKDFIKNGLYRKVSASFYSPASKINPHPGKWSLRHVALLGAQPPAVKGLKGFAYEESTGECWSFSSELKPEEVYDPELGPTMKEDLNPLKMLKDKIDKAKEETKVESSKEMDMVEMEVSMKEKSQNKKESEVDMVMDDEEEMTLKEKPKAKDKKSYESEMISDEEEEVEEMAMKEKSKAKGKKASELEMVSEEEEEEVEEMAMKEKPKTKGKKSPEPEMISDEEEEEVEEMAMKEKPKTKGKKSYESEMISDEEDDELDEMAMKEKPKTKGKKSYESEMISDEEDDELDEMAMKEKAKKAKKSKENEELAKAIDKEVSKLLKELDIEVEDMQEQLVEEVEVEDLKKEGQKKVSVTYSEMGNPDLDRIISRIKELEEANSKLKADVEFAERKAFRTSLKSFTDTLYDSGKLTESVIEQNDLIDYMEGLEYGTYQFSEGESIITPLVNLLNRLPQVISYEEIAPESERVYSEPQDPHEKALQIAKEEGVSYSEALKKALFG